jgi:signal transduction histidine kinase
MNFLVGWLLVATAIGALGARKLFQRQTEARKRIEREVVFNETILANMPTGIAFVDPASHRFLQANETFKQLARRFGQLPVDRAVTDAQYEEVKIAPVDAIEEVLSSGTAFHLTEHPIKDSIGLSHFLDIQLIRLEGSDGNVQGVLYLVEDKTRDIRLRQELIDANAAKDQFLALLSHELRNPLTPVLAMVSELEETMPDSEAVRQALDVIRRNVELEARLIDDLLDVTRIAKGKLQLSFEVVNVHEILRRAYEICCEEITAKQIKTEFVINAGEAHVQGDPARLQQVFWNLIKNSVKFTPENGRITIETLNPTQDEIEIRVNDTGIGIEPDKIDKIFNAFEQGQVSITRRFGGLGLGLAISRAMVDAHSGKIHVNSAGKAQGTTVSVRLRTISAPVIAGDGERESAPVAPAGKEPAMPRHRRLLLVDDHEDTCIGMKRILERRGYKITVAHSAEQAVEKSRVQEFDLLISDIGLPDRSGYELMRELRSKGLRGIALTGFGMEHDVTKARAAGFSEHLTKPINFEHLERAIRQLLT